MGQIVLFCEVLNIRSRSPWKMYTVSFLQHSQLDPGGRTAPLKLEKIRFFCVKSWFFTRNTPKIFVPPSAIGKNMIFWRKIVIFHTKYPKNVRTSLHSAQFFLSATPLTWNPGSAPGISIKNRPNLISRGS